MIQTMKCKLLLIAFCLTTLQMQAQWATIEGPKQENIENLAYTDGVLYGYSKHGIYKSTDEGYTWTLDRKVFNRAGVLAAEYVTDGSNHYINPGTGLSIMRVDADGSMVNIPLDIKPFEGEFVRTITADVGIIYVLVGIRTLYSTDQGDSWQSVTNPVPDVISFALFKGEMYVSNQNKVYRSTDMGQTWPHTAQISGAYGLRLSATTDFLFANAGYSAIYRSSDGSIFEHLETLVAGYGYFDDLIVYNPNGEFAIINRDECAGFSVNRSVNGTFVNFSDPISNRHWAYDCWVKGDHMVLATDRGLLHSTTGGQTFKEDEVIPFVSNDIIEIKKRDNQLAILNSNLNLMNTPIQAINWQYFEEGLLNPDTCLNVSKSIYNVKLTATNNKIFTLFHGKIYNLNATSHRWNEVDLDLTVYDVIHNIAGMGENVYTLVCPALILDTIPSDYKDELSVMSEDGGNAYKLDVVTGGARISFFQPIVSTQESLIFSAADSAGTATFLIDMTADESFSAPFLSSECSAFLFGGVSNIKMEADGERLYSICSGQAYVYEKARQEWQRWTPQNWENGEPLYHKDLRFFRLHKDVFWIGVYGEGLYYATDGSGRFYKYDFQPPNLDVTAIDFDGDEIWVGAADGNVYHSQVQVRKSAQITSPFQVHNSPSADQRLILQSKVPQTAPTELSVFAATGQLVHTTTLPAGTDWTVELPNTVPGMYWVSLRTTDGNVFTEKWVRGR
jgi:hypothetical protein